MLDTDQEKEALSILSAKSKIVFVTDEARGKSGETSN